MPPLGTAPRRSGPGVWKTSKGRTLSPGGAAYWESLYRNGRTDGRGHMVAQQIAPVRPPSPPKPSATQQAAAIRKQHALGKISTVEAQDQLAKLNVYGGKKLSHAEIYPTPTWNRFSQGLEAMSRDL